MKTQEPEVMLVEIACLDLSCQTRASLDWTAVADYTQMVENHSPLDPALVIDNGTTKYLACGFHRREAYLAAGHKTMPCNIIAGDRWDAIQAGIKDNMRHKGVRLKIADKRFDIQLILTERPDTSNSAIGKLVGVSDKTVAACKRDFGIPKSTKVVGCDGRVMDVSNIHQEPSGVLAPATSSSGARVDSRCRCGGEWISDGNGERFCASCNCAHADDVPEITLADGAKAESKLTTQLPATHPSFPATRPDCEELVKTAFMHLGKFSKALDLLHAKLGRSRRREYEARVNEISEMLQHDSDGLIGSAA